MTDLQILTSMLPACMLGVTYVWLFVIVNMVRHDFNVVDAIMQIQTLRLFILIGFILNVAIFLAGVLFK